jgi:peptide/nickel transport system permease protein
VALGRRFLRLLSQRPVGLLGFIGIVFFLLLAFVAPLFVPFQNDPSLVDIYQTPSAAHPLGTDFQGKDVLNQIVFGGRDILTVAILAALVSTAIAITFGSIAAVVGGKVDSTILAITDVVLTLPKLILLIAVAAILRPTGFLFLAVLLGALQWSSLLRQIRSQVLSLKDATTSKPRARWTWGSSTSCSARSCRRCAATSPSTSSSR